MKRMFIFLAFFAGFSIENQAQTVTDYDGNEYPTVQIGTQVWMARNLQTTHYADGTAIIDGTSLGTTWDDFTSKYWFTPNDTASLNPWGALYNWAAAMNGSASSSSNPSQIQGVCPTGWHLPSKAEWETMINYLGGYLVAGGKLKDTANWGATNMGATNETGFSAIPAGIRNPAPLFQYFGEFTYFWSSTEVDAENAYSTGVYWFSAIADTNVSQYKETGISVRCINNNGATGINTINENQIKIHFDSSTDLLHILNAKSNSLAIIYDITGKEVFKAQINSNDAFISLNMIQNGVYIINIGDSSMKFIKQ